MTRTSPYETCRVRRGRGPVPLRDHAAAPTSPPGGVLRQLGLPLRGVWALTSSELPWAVPDGPTLFTTPLATPHDRHRAECSAGHRRPRDQLGPWAARGPRRSCTALDEAAPPAVGSTGTIGRARAAGATRAARLGAGATRRRMHISAPAAARPFWDCGLRAGRRSCATRSGPTRLRMPISAPPAVGPTRGLWAASWPEELRDSELVTRMST
jgi:hypothetical protein